MSVHKFSLKCKISYILLIIIVLIVIVIGVIIRQISLHIEEICKYEGKKAANSAITAAVDSQLQLFEGMQYFTSQTDENGNTVSVQVDSQAVNKTTAAITQQIEIELSNLEKTDIMLPVGSLTGITFLSGRGFDVDLKVYQIGAADVKLKSEFVDAGVNQTKFRIYMDITVETKAVLPGESANVTTNSQFLIGETVIVGEVPRNVVVDKVL